jgi:peptide chain release factor 2
MHRDCSAASLTLWGVFDLPAIEKRISLIEAESAGAGFWDDARRAQSRMREMASLKSHATSWHDIEQRTAALTELLQLAVSESDASMVSQCEQELARLSERFDELEFDLQFSGEYDDRPALVSIKQGAGGVEAQDWAEMLFRMYCRWAERRGWKYEVLDHTPGEEAGIKSATVKIDGEYAYGYLRGERGVHRLVRLSPFDADHLRHTSFALVEVLPEPDGQADVAIRPDDIKFEAFRASGHGGQNVQKVSTAVRLTHLPTGIIVAVQNERSQAQNRDVAMRILRARLIDLEERKRAEERAQLKGEHVSAEFGRQVRNYVLHPYHMVKDTRSGYETSNTQAVLDGDLDEMLRAGLRAQVPSRAPGG